MKDYKIAVIGDVHSNYVGLEKCMEHALSQKPDEFLFLGDYISDCPYPQKTMNIIYEMDKNYKCNFIRGNREEYMLNHRKNVDERWTYSSASGSLLYTYENLTQKDFSFFESLNIQGYYNKEGYQPFRYCHGSLTRSNEILEPEGENTKIFMGSLDVDLLVSGHMHFQEDKFYGKKRLLHPGAVGVSWYFDGKTQYMILHGSKSGWEAEFFQLDYDVEKIIRDFETSGLHQKAPSWSEITMYTLRTGIDHNFDCLNRAKELCRQAEGSVTWPDIPEEYWKQALKEFGIS
ncbi:MAG: metallophosphoesterase [Lachnospiraceae bacterium]|nr:metallophosphoesterase [Lachnospiraceae bacterium]